MAGLRLGDGERELGRVPVTDTRDGKAGWIVLTDRRVCLLGRTPRSGLFGTTHERITTQIQRANVATIERTGPATLKVATHGEGYGRIWFEVSLAGERTEEWIARLVEWAGVEPPPEPLPVAKVIKRG